ncbi:YbgA family protein [Alteribacter natronophilus]|uniref:YbgA family protein n=1 Tax=Alteribacter natronophilus TaxID=2583810 RepID=UPI00110DBF05|nr:DUF523 and DUF1722 domain-containing protein [Alteribacter natronophilus]TMW73503.1 DUF1722 domain-containing protein [Alteribacter natronophilus]
MRDFHRPQIVVSKCLEFEACRYDGAKMRSTAVEKLRETADLIPVCPEVEIGLPVPRDTLRLVDKGEGERLVMPSREKDYTGEMIAFSDKYLRNLKKADGFILKGRSPSCGIFDAKVYAGSGKSPVKGRTAGMFARKVKEHFPHSLLEDDGRLRNFAIREQFLTGVFTMASFRHTRKEGTAGALSRFHADNKFLLMSYSPRLMQEAGRIAANPGGMNKKELFAAYEQVLKIILTNRQKDTGNISVCEHLLGFFKNSLSSREKEHFLTLLGQYRQKRVPLSSLLSLIRSWVYRFEQKYLTSQTYFEPYPSELVEISDSGKGRDY